MFILFGIIVFVIILTLIIYYNYFVCGKNNVKSSLSTVDIMLKKRYDLIPNLVSTVKGYAKHEKDILTRVVELRTKAMSQPTGSVENENTENMLAGTLKSIFMLTENYPELKANQNFLMLQRSLNEIEEQISASRRTYNAMVNSYNTSVESFPGNILAKQFGFRRWEFFKVNDNEKNSVKVKL
ncbi:MAG: LemA family protein [Candidatus Muirbacterium halophilum]|nr:LemA family protein [Candidatus Muirbacterium halophilum]